MYLSNLFKNTTSGEITKNRRQKVMKTQVVELEKKMTVYAAFQLS